MTRLSPSGASWLHKRGGYPRTTFIRPAHAGTEPEASFRDSVLLCNADGVISTWAQQDWAAFAAALAEGKKAEWQAALQRFLLGVAYRMEELQAHEMAELMDTTDLSEGARAELLDHVEFSLGLLAAYGRLVMEDDDQEGPEMADDAHSVGPGDLVI